MMKPAALDATSMVAPIGLQSLEGLIMIHLGIGPTDAISSGLGWAKTPASGLGLIAPARLWASEASIGGVGLDLILWSRARQPHPRPRRGGSEAHPRHFRGVTHPLKR